MDSDIIDVVAEWDSTPVSGGYAGLHDLADRGFTGAVSEGSVWAFVLNGKVVGVFDGSIEAFEDADATAYHAPDPALPLLYAMQTGDSETRAKYYSNDTPLSSADATLSSGSFTGYIELSENVLSGDYYVVYYGGKSMSVAYVGNNRKLLAGDEAFERANDEVGIYHVKEASVDIVEIPAVPETPEPTESPEQDDTADTSAVAVDADTESESETPDEHKTEERDERDEREPVDGEPTAASTADTPTTAAVDHEGDEATNSPVDDRPATDVSETPRADADHAEPVSTADSVADVPEADETTTEPVPDAASTEEGAVEASDEPEPVETTEATEPPASSPQERAGAQVGTSTDASEEATGAAANADVFSEEAEWREATSIPALDPKSSQNSQKKQSAGQHASSDADSTDRNRPNASDSTSASAGQNAVRKQRRRQSPQQHQETDAQSESSETSGGPQRADVARLEQRLRATAEQKQALETAQERLTTERDEYREKADRLQTRVSELASEVDRLEGELQNARSGSAAATSTPTETMPADAALDGTNLFVRYGTKSGGTLEKAHAGESERGEVNENLRLEHHTGFETEGLAVDGESYETFLHGSIEYGFVRWVVEDLLYEIRETGNQGNLDELFDAIPNIDRAELHGDVTLKYTEDGEEHREQQSFDVVLRDRMGNPLVVANLNGSRDPATEEMMTSLVENTSRLRESNESLGAAFLVTASYFDPGALETAADATGGGLLSRGRRKSFVKLSRKQGFHLCLVETRNGDFHLNVPEL